MNDAVLSYHVNEFGCGVARFSKQLAQRLDVPFKVYGTLAKRPLINVKFAELGPAVPDPTFYYTAYDLFLHDAPTQARHRTWVRNANKVYAGDPTIADAVQSIRRDAVSLWCPPTIQGDASRGRFRVLLFGMSHKLQRGYYEKLRDLLDASGRDYTVQLSAWVHEGRVWDDEFQAVKAAAVEVFGDHLRMLGHLADDAIARELKDTDCCALFFDPGARANNTTLWAALQAGCPVITNLDGQSPAVLRDVVFDIRSLETLPSQVQVITAGEASVTAASQYGWVPFLSAFREVACGA